MYNLRFELKSLAVALVQITKSPRSASTLQHWGLWMCHFQPSPLLSAPMPPASLEILTGKTHLFLKAPVCSPGFKCSVLYTHMAMSSSRSKPTTSKNFFFGYLAIQIFPCAGAGGVCACSSLCVCTFVEAKSNHEYGSSRTVHLSFWDRDSHLPGASQLGKTWWLGNHENPPVSASRVLGLHIYLPSFIRVLGLNTGPHACKTNMLPTKTSIST